MSVNKFLYINELTQNEHRKENDAKAVDNYGWDADNLQWVRQSVDSTGKLNVNATVTVDPTGLATDTNQTNGAQKTQIVDAGGEAVTVTGGKLDVNATVSTTGLATETKQDAQITQITDLTKDNVHTGEKEFRVFSEGHVCTDNSTNTPLGISGLFTGGWQDTLDYSEIITTIYTDKSSTTDGMKIWWSADGITQDPDPDTFTITGGVSKTFSFPCNRRYVKLTYQNDGVAQTIMMLSTELKRFASKGSSHRLADTLNQQDDAIVTKSLVAGKTTAGGGGIVDVKVNPSGALTVDATQSGVWNITDITGTVSLPTGASTAAKQLPDNHQVTVSNIASTPLITGFATSAKQDTLLTELQLKADLTETQPVSIATMPTTPVTGTFWQATQPVSIATAPVLVAGSAIIGKVGIDQTTPGTTNKVTLGSDVVHTIIDSATLGTVTVTGGLTDTQLRASAVPVSLASVPSHNVTNAGTFAVQSTNQANSGVDIGDVTINNASGVSAVNIQDGGNSITVDGTFYQATQPVSAASLPLPTGASTSANQSTGNGYLSGIAGLLPTAYDNITQTQNSTQDIWTFKLVATTVAVITITYTDTTKLIISTVVKT